MLHRVYKTNNQCIISYNSATIQYSQKQRLLRFKCIYHLDILIVTRGATCNT